MREGGEGEKKQEKEKENPILKFVSFPALNCHRSSMTFHANERSPWYLMYSKHPRVKKRTNE